MEACPNPKIVLSWRDRHVFLCGGLPKLQNRPISAREGDFALWRPAQTPKSSYLGEIGTFSSAQTPKLSRRDAQTPKSSYLGEIGTFSSVQACPNPKIVRPISAREGDLALWRPAQTPKSSYLGEIGTFSSVEACPNSKIVLSRREKAILLCGGLPKPQNRPSWRDRHVFLCGGLPKPQNRPSYLGVIRRFCLWRPAQIRESSYLGEIGTFSSVEACPNPKNVLSRREKATLLCGGLPKPQNRPISAG